MAGGNCSEHVFIFLITNSVKKALQKNLKPNITKKL